MRSTTLPWLATRVLRPVMADHNFASRPDSARLAIRPSPRTQSTPPRSPAMMPRVVRFMNSGFRAGAAEGSDMDVIVVFTGDTLGVTKVRHRPFRVTGLCAVADRNTRRHYQRMWLHISGTDGDLHTP